MKDRQDSTARGPLTLTLSPLRGARANGLFSIWLVAVTAGACRRSPPSPAAEPETTADKVLADVVDPWTWPRAAGAADRERAIEDIGPYERAAAGDPSSPLVNTNARYWTALAGIAWDRDVNIAIDGEPVDLDGDGRADTKVTRRIRAPGGVLANPELFGLTRTPDDPRGRVGRISASTGVLGLREALRPDGTPSGEIGMTCWLCHGGKNPTDGSNALGVPGTAFDYGLLLATAAVLDEGNAAAAGYRRARGFPAGRTVRARLLLAGPGRQDLTGEFGLDVTVPGMHSARYPGTARVRQGIRGVVNPISVPGILAAPGLALENWSGSEDAAAPWLERLVALARRPEPETRAAFALPAGDRGAARRALLFDLRNLGTLGLQDDSFPGLLWSDAIYGRAELSPAAALAIPSMYAAAAVRSVLAGDAAALARPARDAERIARGRAVFAERIVGTIANRQIFKRAPRAYAAAKLDGPVLAPIDPTKALDAKLAVRCADCHSAAPLENPRPLADNPPPLGRCTHCHTAHVALEEWADSPGGGPSPYPLPAGRGEGNLGGDLVSLMNPVRTPVAEVTFCAGCHKTHRDFGPVVYSSSRLFPFDADGDGDAQGNPAADRRAAGIGTDPLLAFDVPLPERPFSVEIPLLAHPSRPGRVSRARVGMSWVRAAPLIALNASAPYLHNGSVPTLPALLEPAARRPVTFPLGAAGFVLDTRLPGNGNAGHEFGTALSPADKQDLIAFLESL